MGCKAFDVIYFEQDGPNDSKVFRTLGSQGIPVIKGNTRVEYHCYSDNLEQEIMQYLLKIGIII